MESLEILQEMDFFLCELVVGSFSDELHCSSDFMKPHILIFHIVAAKYY